MGTPEKQIDLEEAIAATVPVYYDNPVEWLDQLIDFLRQTQSLRALRIGPSAFRVRPIGHKSQKAQ
jgi:hypothetical protein